MNCQDVKKILIPFIDSELSGSLRVMIMKHLEECPDCRKEHELLEKTWSMLDGFKTPKVSDDFTRDLMAVIRERKQEKSKFSFSFPEINIQLGFKALVPAMAVACVVILVYLFIQSYFVRQPQFAENIAVPPKTVLIEQKARAQIADEDIIRNLDAYENAELYKEYGLVKDIDVVENLNTQV